MSQSVMARIISGKSITESDEPINPQDVIKKIVDDKEWSAPFYFIQGSDTQFGMIQREISKKEVPNWDKEVELSKKCVKAINALNPKPKFFIISGDMLDAYPVAETINTRKEQEKDFFRIFNEIDKSIPIICVCGNHDVGEIPTKETVQSYRNVFGDDFYSFWVGGVLFLVINTQYYVDSSQVSDILKLQEKFIDKTLKDAKKSKVGAVVFQHIPPFLKDPGETDNGKFSLKAPERTNLLNKFNKGGVKYIFSGHCHYNGGGMFENIETVITSSIGGQLGTDKSGFRICKVKETGIEHEYLPFDKMPKTISI